MNGKFIVLEGIDGAGTTSQLDRVVSFLRGLGRRAETTCEPSLGPVGKLIREILLGNHLVPGGQKVCGEAMALLFAADRFDHLNREVLPKLQTGIDVVSDRYLLSSLAYQSEESDVAWVETLGKGILTPDLTIVFDLPVSIAFERRRAAGRPTERYDADATQEKVRLNYLHLANRQPRIEVVDASLSKDDVTKNICNVIAHRFNWRLSNQGF